jgi:hypothetical protein
MAKYAARTMISLQPDQHPLRNNQNMTCMRKNHPMLLPTLSPPSLSGVDVSGFLVSSPEGAIPHPDGAFHLIFINPSWYETKLGSWVEVEHRRVKLRD